MANRINRNRNKTETHDADDAFIAGVLDASTWAKRNQSTVTVGLIALLVVLAGGWYWINYSSSLEDRALAEFEQIQNTLSLGDPEAGKTALAQFLESYGGTAVAGEASLELAQLYLESDQPGQALSTLAASGVGLRDPLGPQVYTLRGRAMEAQSRWADAESLYMEVAGASRIAFQRHAALADAARMRAQQSNLEGAVALYDEILEEMEPSNPDRGEYEMRKAELETTLAG